MRIEDIMTEKPITLTPNDTFRKAVRIMASKNITGCPVVAGNKLVGVITQTDVIRAMDIYGKINKNNEIFALVSSILKSKSQDGGYARKLLGTRVKEIMKKGVVSINVENNVYEAARLMNKHGIDRLPVTKGKQLVGILTKKDIMKFLEKVDI